MEKVTLVYRAPGTQQDQEQPVYLSRDGKLHLPYVRDEFKLRRIKLDGVGVPDDLEYSPATYAPDARIVVSGSPLPTGRSAHEAPPDDSLLAEVKREVLEVKRMVTEASEATRHASTITEQDLDAAAAALRITFVPCNLDSVDEATSVSYLDQTEFAWEDNKHEAKHQQSYLAEISKQLQLPGHLRFSKRTDRSSVLKTSMHTGGAPLPFNIGCRTDALVVATRARLAEEGAIACTLELKKKVVAQSLRQTKITYICASLKSQLPVISCCTDMDKAAVAYYTSGQRRNDGMCIVNECFFKDTSEMLQWLCQALSTQSVTSDTLRFVGNQLVLPEELPNPKRIRLPVPPAPAVGRNATEDMLARLLYAGGDDIACMADLDDVQDDAPYLSYFS